MAAWRSVTESPATTTGMIDGHADGGYTGRYEVICLACGDDPNLSYDQVPPELQKIRGPRESLLSGLAALDAHTGLADTAPDRARATLRPR